MCCTELAVFWCNPKHSHIGCRHAKYVTKEWIITHCLNVRRKCDLRNKIRKMAEQKAKTETV